MVTRRGGWETRSEFRPAFGLGNSHVQTFAGKVLRPTLDIELHRERIETVDGDFLDLDFAGWPPTAPDAMDHAPLVLVLHGLEGTSRRRYMTSTYHALLGAGMRPVALNFRGCSGEPNRTVRAYHSGETEDLEFILELLRDRFGGPLGLVGYSLGGNVALKFLGEMGDRAVVDLDPRQIIDRRHGSARPVLTGPSWCWAGTARSPGRRRG
jgi:uncharacterized protein